MFQPLDRKQKVLSLPFFPGLIPFSRIFIKNHKIQGFFQVYCQFQGFSGFPRQVRTLNSATYCTNRINCFLAYFYTSSPFQYPKCAIPLQADFSKFSINILSKYYLCTDFNFFGKNEDNKRHLYSVNTYPSNFGVRLLFYMGGGALLILFLVLKGKQIPKNEKERDLRGTYLIGDWRAPGYNGHFEHISAYNDS